MRSFGLMMYELSPGTEREKRNWVMVQILGEFYYTRGASIHLYEAPPARRNFYAALEFESAAKWRGAGRPRIYIYNISIGDKSVGPEKSRARCVRMRERQMSPSVLE